MTPDRLPISTVVFDFDGVIADTERLHLGAFQDAFADRGWTLDEHAYFDRYLGWDDHGLIDAYTRDHGLTIDPADAQALVDAKTRAFSRHLSSAAVVFPDAHACIEALAGAFTLGIASGAQGHEIAAILRAADLQSFFRTIVAAEDVPACKPSPVPYLAAAARLGADPAACVAIEDSVAGLQAARAAGMRTIALTTTSPRHALAIGADLVVDSLAALTPDIVAALGGQPAL
jgi:HAD superfamily hydrolase (TIGR01509 family)